MPQVSTPRPSFSLSWHPCVLVLVFFHTHSGIAACVSFFCSWLLLFVFFSFFCGHSMLLFFGSWAQRTKTATGSCWTRALHPGPLCRAPLAPPWHLPFATPSSSSSKVISGRSRLLGSPRVPFGAPWCVACSSMVARGFESAGLTGGSHACAACRNPGAGHLLAAVLPPGVIRWTLAVGIVLR